MLIGVYSDRFAVWRVVVGVNRHLLEKDAMFIENPHCFLN